MSTRLSEQTGLTKKEQTTMTTFTVTVGRVPGTITNVAVNEGSTVSDVLRSASINLTTGEEVRINGTTSPLTQAVNDGDRIFIVKQIKGNQIIVTVGRVPGAISDVSLVSNSPISEVLRVAGITLAAGEEVRVDGNPATLTTVVGDGARVFIVKQIKGNQIVVTVGRVPGAIANVSLLEEGTVQEVLRVANITLAAGEEVRVDGEAATLDTEVEDGARVFIVKQIKGN